MTTLTIDIPDGRTQEVLTQLEKLGVKVRESKLNSLDKLTKEEYQNHFAKQGKSNKEKHSKFNVL